MASTLTGEMGCSPSMSIWQHLRASNVTFPLSFFFFFPSFHSLSHSFHSASYSRNGLYSSAQKAEFTHAS